MSKIGEGGIDNQWFKGAEMTIVPRPSQDVCMRVPRPFFLRLCLRRSAEPCRVKVTGYRLQVKGYGLSPFRRRPVSPLSGDTSGLMVEQRTKDKGQGTRSGVV